MVALGQTITVVNKSGKVVSSSKHLVNVFKEARSAYRERKAEIRVTRSSELEEKKARKRLETLTIADGDDTASRASSRRSSVDSRASDLPRRKPVPKRERQPMERGYSDSFYANDERDRRTKRPSPLRFETDGTLRNTDHARNELVRRHTDDGMDHHQRARTPVRSSSMSDIDMDLAYGEPPPPLPVRRGEEELELRYKMTTLQQLLDECNCLQHSVTATIDNLQKNPDALAAVALTLAEISNLASKMAPGVLMSMKGAFPVIIALLCSPQFMIAAGVGVGVTIIAFGGYKIIKKIKAKKEREGEEEPPNEFDELQEIDRIEMWRRGIAESQAESPGTSVDGEFVTPMASRTLIEEGRLRQDELKPTTAGKNKDKKRRKKSSSKASSESGGKKEKSKKKKEPSGLKMLFKSHA